MFATSAQISDGNISFSRYFMLRKESKRKKKVAWWKRRIKNVSSIWRKMSTITRYDGRESRDFLSRSLFSFLIDYNRMFEYYSPISNAAELGLTLNWFSISFGRNAAKPAISNPSLAPARFNMKNPGLPSRSVRARGSSRIFENASPRSLEDGCSGFWCASDTRSLANFSEPEKRGVIVEESINVPLARNISTIAYLGKYVVYMNIWTM